MQLAESRAKLREIADQNSGELGELKDEIGFVREVGPTASTNKNAEAPARYGHLRELRVGVGPVTLHLTTCFDARDLNLRRHRGNS